MISKEDLAMLEEAEKEYEEENGGYRVENAYLLISKDNYYDGVVLDKEVAIEKGYTSEGPCENKNQYVLVPLYVRESLQ